MAEVATVESTPKRALWFALGWLCFAVGAIGVLLPGIPTTGPMILALACFARSSPRLHDWLLSHRLFGPPLQRWKAHRLIPIRAKVAAVSMMTLSFVYVAFLSPLPLWAVALTGVLVVVGAAFVLSCPHSVPSSSVPSSSVPSSSVPSSSVPSSSAAATT